MASNKRKERKAESTNALKKQVNNTKKPSQRQVVLKYLQTHKRGITSMQAFDLFKYTRLSGIIHDLRKQGHDIETEKRYTKDGTMYGRYIYHGRKNNEDV